VIRVQELMSTGVIAVRDTDTVERAEREMRIAGIRHLPVVDDRGHVVGIVSDRDLLKAIGAKKAKTQRLGAVMTRDVRTVRPVTSAHAAVELMLEGKFGALPVVGEDGVMVGIVTETDFLGLAHSALGDGTLTRKQ
jgi:CBS domain-containing membrane protein